MGKGGEKERMGRKKGKGTMGEKGSSGEIKN